MTAKLRRREGGVERFRSFFVRKGRLQAAAITSGDRVVGGADAAGRAVLAAAKPIEGPDWTEIAAQPAAEAYQPIRAALWRTAFLLLAG